MEEKQTAKYLLRVISDLSQLAPAAKKFTTISRALQGGVTIKVTNNVLARIQEALPATNEQAASLLLSQTSYSERAWAVQFLVLLLELRNRASQLTNRNLFAQIFSGHRDMRDSHELMVLLNDTLSKGGLSEEGGHEPRPLRLYSELLVKRISGFSLPVLFSQCRSYFYNSIEELKFPQIERKIQPLFQRRYDIVNIIQVSFDMFRIKGSPSINRMVDFIFLNTEKDYVFEQFYPAEARPLLHLSLRMNAHFFQYIQNIEDIRALGQFSIGAPSIPPNQIPKSSQKSPSHLEQYLGLKASLKKERILSLCHKYGQTLSFPIDSYEWSVQMWVLKPHNETLKQFDCSSATIIREKEVGYDPFKVATIPCSFGESSSLLSKQLYFLNQMDDSVHGMHLQLNFITKSGRIPPTEKQLPKDAFLGIINLSRSGWSLRVQLLPNRRWLVSQSLVFQIDLPEDYQSEEYEEEDFCAHYVYEVAYLNEEDDSLLSLGLQDGRVSSWEEMDEIYIEIREFVTKEVVAGLRPGERLDVVKLIVWDVSKEEDVTQHFQNREERELPKNGLELCLVAESAEVENVWVWAREVLNPQKRKRKEKLAPEMCVTYFEFDPIYSQKDLTRAPSKCVTSSDILSFGIQRFRVLFEGVFNYHRKKEEVLLNNQNKTTQDKLSQEAGGESYAKKSYIRAL